MSGIALARSPRSPAQRSVRAGARKAISYQLLSLLLFTLGLSLSVVGVAKDAHLLTFGGLFTIALTVRYRKSPLVWEYLAFAVLALIIVALAPPSSPLMGAIPLMLSYVLDYIDEQRQKRLAHPPAALATDTTNHPRSAQYEQGREKRFPISA
jgi:hypothetical protein